jgi:hypothetical protein
MYRRGVLSRWLGNTDQNKVHQEERERSGGGGESVDVGESAREVESILGGEGDYDDTRNKRSRVALTRRRRSGR